MVGKRKTCLKTGSKGSGIWVYENYRIVYRGNSWEIWVDVSDIFDTEKLPLKLKKCRNGN